MMDKRQILHSLLNGDVAALNQLPRITLFCTTDNHSNGICQVTPPYGQTLPKWAKPEMTKEEIEAARTNHNVLFIIIEKTYE
ncbi:hypothetical protein [Runella slithyformis]|uniref:Uncharacterized protein n=1 Tax=Runella slithyformis (strain ATCC 29530 / DSM 19594 / LMG 11500 / NCIMB 11436 / LSU 4) TaxID=761193 RepID=A0A7U4E6L5_RUNSL|nr:hypothetical protein [Runella slithyformis]AEI49721.1 hypothetical protein Runsl_3353 [Runella slithyformis DSM 19594]